MHSNPCFEKYFYRYQGRSPPLLSLLPRPLVAATHLCGVCPVELGGEVEALARRLRGLAPALTGHTPTITGIRLLAERQVSPGHACLYVKLVLTRPCPCRGPAVATCSQGSGAGPQQPNSTIQWHNTSVDQNTAART